MNITESQAKSFIKDLYRRDKRITIELLKDRIDSKIYNFKRDKDKLDFLKILKIEVEIDFKNHKLTCSNPDCSYDSQANLSIFLIEQEIDYINETYTFIPKSDDQFTVEEETSLHGKLNEILDRLNKQGLGHEILFDEIESLKSHFNLGKKTWVQLFYGKIFSVTVDKTIEETITKSIINEITDMVGNTMKLIP